MGIVCADVDFVEVLGLWLMGIRREGSGGPLPGECVLGLPLSSPDPLGLIGG